MRRGRLLALALLALSCSVIVILCLVIEVEWLQLTGRRVVLEPYNYVVPSLASSASDLEVSPLHPARRVVPSYDPVVNQTWKQLATAPKLQRTRFRQSGFLPFPTASSNKALPEQAPNERWPRYGRSEQQLQGAELRYRRENRMKTAVGWCARYRVVFARIPGGGSGEYMRMSIAAIQRNAGALVDFPGCLAWQRYEQQQQANKKSVSPTPGADGPTVNSDLTQAHLDECCKDVDNFTGVVYPTTTGKDSNRPYTPIHRPASAERGRRFGAHRTLLIVIFNHAYYANTEFLLELYQGIFAGVVFYGPKASARWNVTGVDLQEGLLLHRAIAQAMLDHPDHGSYLWIGDDVFLNYPMLARTVLLQPQRVWMSKPWRVVDAFNSSHHHLNWMNHSAFGAHRFPEACIPQELVSRMQCLQPRWPAILGKSVSDVGYVPRHLTAPFLTMAHAFRNLFEELALPTLLNVIVENVDTDLSPWPATGYLLDSRTPAAAQEMWSQRNVTFIHPLKFSSSGTRAMARKWLAQALERFPCPS